MATKIKLGNGNWGVKPNGVLAYNDEDNVFKAIELQSSRASGATYVGEDGLIKDAEVGVPRIDWTNGVGELLLEPQSTNEVTNSESINPYFTNDGVSVTNNYGVAPDGSSTSNLITQTVGSSSNSIYRFGLSTTNGDYSYSFFFKAGTSTSVRLYVGDAIFEDFNPQSVTEGRTGGSLDILFEDYGNGWWRASTSVNLVSPSFNRFIIYPDRGNLGRTIELWGVQHEENISYSTSYIRTSGTTVTRIADAVTGNSSLGQYINSSEGVLYFEASSDFQNFNRRITISNNKSSNRATIRYLINGASVNYLLVSGGSEEVNQVVALSQADNSKIAFKYKENDFALWVNGVELSTQTFGTTFPSNNLKNLAFDRGDGSGSDPFYGRIKELKVYDTALTDSELQALTS